MIHPIKRGRLIVAEPREVRDAERSSNARPPLEAMYQRVDDDLADL